MTHTNGSWDDLEMYKKYEEHMKKDSNTEPEKDFLSELDDLGILRQMIRHYEYKVKYHEKNMSNLFEELSKILKPNKFKELKERFDRLL